MRICVATLGLEPGQHIRVTVTVAGMSHEGVVSYNTCTSNSQSGTEMNHVPSHSEFQDGLPSIKHALIGHVFVKRIKPCIWALLFFGSAS